MFGEKLLLTTSAVLFWVVQEVASGSNRVETQMLRIGCDRLTEVMFVKSMFNVFGLCTGNSSFELWRS